MIWRINCSSILRRMGKMKGRIISKREGRKIIMATIIMAIMKVINNKVSE